MGQIAFSDIKKTPNVKGVDSTVVFLDCDKPGALKSNKQHDEVMAAALAFAKKIGHEFKPGKILSFDLSLQHRVVAIGVSKKMNAFQFLEAARKLWAPLKAVKAKGVLVDLRNVEGIEESLVDAVCSAAEVAHYETHKYKSSKSQADWNLRASTWNVVFHVDKKRHRSLKQVAETSVIRANSTNLVRRLMEMAGNDLTCSRYVKILRDMAKKNQWTYQFTSIAKLEKMGAGAFTAVTRASRDSGGGIVKLEYKPRSGAKKHSTKRLALVGKGITYDTGGVNLKPPAYMYGMHGDMGGSAVALAILAVASAEQWSFPVTAYLAIADNHINDRAYKPNDVVFSLSGKSIEIIHTDAEGRMILADTLALACSDGASAILDFATLTGACMQAIGTTYSGAFSNREQMIGELIEAGRCSGERIWPFPNDEDFGDCLSSDIADIKQCRLRGGVDHIEAAHFLSEFVDKKIPWVHIDLASAEHDGGLGHVPSKVTGFGVRVGIEVAQRLWKQR